MTASVIVFSVLTAVAWAATYGLNHRSGGRSQAAAVLLFFVVSCLLTIIDAALIVIWLLTQ